MAENVAPRAYSVSEINNYLREYVAEDEFLADIMVRGELTGYKQHSSGHIYFMLSEGGCSLSGVMFRSQAERVSFLPQTGMELAIWGGLRLYERDGVVRLYAREFFPLGEGLSGAALTRLKEKLAAEGLFDARRKQALPLIPQSLGVVSAAASAAWADIQAVAYQRWPGLKIQLYPALVQGTEAPASIAAALAKADKAGHSVLIVGRGGGAQEDLSAFNTEVVARAMAGAYTPLISAVGHEIDLTLADLAADLRASTPSHAASLAVPQKSEIMERLTGYELRLRQALTRGIMIQQRRLKTVQDRLRQAAIAAMRQRRAELNMLAASLHSLSPLAALTRGYAICLNAARQTLRRSGEAAI
ncbi:MAG: exodeoxyribonuclease VII large subunit, partial [Clostridiales bacterium]|nr:exodeoxyribonuclease VII large subunit [Clostridiales bacterium]